MEKSTTDDLLQALINTDDLPSFLSENGERLRVPSLSEHLEALLAAHGRKKADVIRDSGLDVSYAYQVFQGVRTPARDKLLLIAFALPLSLQETLKLLRVASAPGLYVKNKRDSIIIFALEHGQSLGELNRLLEEENEDYLS